MNAIIRGVADGEEHLNDDDSNIDNVLINHQTGFPPTIPQSSDSDPDSESNDDIDDDEFLDPEDPMNDNDEDEDVEWGAGEEDEWNEDDEIFLPGGGTRAFTASDWQDELLLQASSSSGGDQSMDRTKEIALFGLIQDASEAVKLHQAMDKIESLESVLKWMGLDSLDIHSLLSFLKDLQSKPKNAESPLDANLPLWYDEQHKYITFGGLLPPHPMYFSGWRGNPFIRGAMSPHWSLRPLENKEDLIEFVKQFLERNSISSKPTQPTSIENGNSISVGSAIAQCRMLVDIVRATMVAKANLQKRVRDWHADWDQSPNLLSEEGQVAAIEDLPDNPLTRRIRYKQSIASLLATSKANIVLTSPGQPYQWAHSASTSNHFQCSCSLVLGALEPVSIFPHRTSVQTSLEKSVSELSERPSSPPTYPIQLLQRPYTISCNSILRTGSNLLADSEDAIDRIAAGDLVGISLAPDVFPYTAYLSSDHIVKKRLMGLDFDPICCDMQYGFLAVGSDEGTLAVFCMLDDKPEYVMIHRSSRYDMFNSVQITRREVREGVWIYTLLASLNSGKVEVFLLDSHPRPSSESSTAPSPSTRKPSKSPLHGSVIRDHILSNFSGTPINDARLSPDARFLVCVGDRGGLWLTKITYKESSTENLDLKAGGLNIDSDVELSDEVHEDSDPSLPIRVFGLPRKVALDELFWEPPAPESVEGEVQQEPKVGKVPGNFSMQYVSWSCDSRYFAASSDRQPWVLVFDARRDGKVVARLDAGAPALSVTWNPTQPYLLAFSNRFNYVHVVDLSPILSRNGESTTPTTIPSLDTPSYPFHHFPSLPRQILRHDYKVPTFVHDEHEDDNEQEAVRGGQEEMVHPRPRIIRVAVDPTTTAPTTTQPNESRRPLDATLQNHNAIVHAYRTIFSKINGLQWSQSGRELYIATNRRVLMYTLSEPESLLEQSRKKVWGVYLEQGQDGLKELDGGSSVGDGEGFAGDVVKGWMRQQGWVGHWEDA
ncbi:hypothetical protein HDV05_005395 [Chytridiales sp. JEL 0842]|nr:hypothetical protein HDV05_005395 [Chytridiales sp. JEL 0842]